MITSHFAVFAREYDHRIVKLPGFAQRIKHLAHLPIHQRDVGEVLRAQSAPTVFSRQIVIVVDTQRV